MSVKSKYVPEVGKAMYEKIRAEMEANHRGKMVVIDVNTGDYEIADDDLTATMRLFERRPNAITWGELVGHPVTCYIGGGAFRLMAKDLPKDD